MNSTRLKFEPSLLLAFILFLIMPAVAQKPQEADKLAQRGAEYLRKNDWRRAAEQYQKAVRANPNHAEAQYGLGAAYMGLGQQSEALEAFSQVVRLKPNPRVAEALVQSGVIHAGAKRYQ